LPVSAAPAGAENYSQSFPAASRRRLISNALPAQKQMSTELRTHQET